MAGLFGSPMAAMGPTPAAVVGSRAGTLGASGGSVSTVTLPTGTAVGDTLFLFGNTASSFAPSLGGTSAGSWTSGVLDGGGNNTWYAYKKLVDLGSITITAGGAPLGLYHVLAVRNVYGVAVKQNSGFVAPSAGVFTYSGFTKSGLHLGVVAVLGAQEGAAAGNTFTINGGFSADQYTSSATGPNTTQQNLLTAHNLAYVSGATPAVSGISATHVQALLLELLSA